MRATLRAGETVCALTKGTLQAGGLECIIYTTLMVGRLYDPYSLKAPGFKP